MLVEAAAVLELGMAAVLVGMAARAAAGVEREPAQVQEAALELGPEAVLAGWGVSASVLMRQLAPGPLPRSALVLTRPSAPVRMLQSEPERGMPSDMVPVMALETRGRSTGRHRLRPRARHGQCVRIRPRRRHRKPGFRPARRHRFWSRGTKVEKSKPRGRGDKTPASIY